MKIMIAVEIDIDPDDELKCGLKCIALNTEDGTLNYCEIPQFGPAVVNGNRRQECLKAGIVMTHCKEEEN